MKRKKERKRAPKGNGWIHPRGNVYIACIKFKRPGEAKAKLYRESTGFFVDRDEKQKAEEYLRQFSAKVRTGAINPPGPPPATLKDLREEYLRDVRLNHPRHEKRVGQSFKRLVDYFGLDKVAAEIDGDAIAEYIDARLKVKIGKEPKAKEGEPKEVTERRTITRGTVNRELSVLRRAFKLYRRAESSRKEKRLATWPEIVLLTEDNVRERCPTDDELEKVIKELPDRLKAPMRFAALTGWRIANVLGLQWVRVNEAEGMIRVPARETKGGKRAKRKKALVLPYSADPDLAQLIRERRAATDEYEREHSAGAVKKAVPYVFWFDGVDEHGRQGAVPNTEYRRAWERACKRAKVEDLHVHDLRRHYAARAVRAGVDENTIMLLAGWSTRSMFDRYSVRNEADRVAAVARMASARAAEQSQDEPQDAQAQNS